MDVLSLLVNIFMAGLLSATLWYCWRLNNRIKLLQDSRSELAKIIREFDASTQRATQSIADIHAATERLSDNIQHKIDKANYLATDLELMIERGNKMAGGSRVEPATRSAAREMPRAPVPEAPNMMPSRVALEKAHGVDIKEAPSELPRRRLRSRAEQDVVSLLKSKNEAR